MKRFGLLEHPSTVVQVVSVDMGVWMCGCVDVWVCGCVGSCLRELAVAGVPAKAYHNEYKLCSVHLPYTHRPNPDSAGRCQAVKLPVVTPPRPHLRSRPCSIDPTATSSSLARVVTTSPSSPEFLPARPTTSPSSHSQACSDTYKGSKYRSI